MSKLPYARALFVLALVLLASPAAGEPVRVWLGGVADVDHSAYRDFTISTSPTAYVTLHINNGLHQFTAADGPNVAALFADMTNGVNNPLTFSTSTFTYTVDEDHFFTTTPTPPPIVGSSSYITPPAIDLAGWNIDYIQLSRSNSGGIRRYHFEVLAHVPEPSTPAMLLMLCVGLAHIRISSSRMGPLRRSIAR